MHALGDLEVFIQREVRIDVTRPGAATGSGLIAVRQRSACYGRRRSCKSKWIEVLKDTAFRRARFAWVHTWNDGGTLSAISVGGKITGLRNSKGTAVLEHHDVMEAPPADDRIDCAIGVSEEGLAASEGKLPRPGKTEAVRNIVGRARIF